jgi:CheY-like chemotaxis protein
MEKTLQWLRNVEQLASDVYSAAALELKDDKEFSSFLQQMTEDEAWHFHLISSAIQHLSEMDDKPSLDIIVDSVMTKVIEVPFQDLFNRISDETVTRQDVVDFIVKLEFAELNHIFLYVLNTLQQSCRTFEYAAGVMQAHQKRIKRFLVNLPSDIKIPDDLKKLPPIWKEKILIVEDEMAVRELFGHVLSDLGAIETANNGKEALDKVRDHFFNVIISDINMPVMDGVEFFQKALETDSNIKNRFLFCSGDITPEIEELYKEHGIKLLEKPINIQEVKEAVKDVIDRSL